MFWDHKAQSICAGTLVRLVHPTGANMAAGSTAVAQPGGAIDGPKFLI